MPPPFMLPPAGFIPGRAAFFYPRLRPRPRIPSPRSAGVGHDGRIAPLRRQPCRQRTPLRALSGSGLPHTHSTLGRGGVKAQCLPAAIPHGIGFLSRHAGQSPQPAFPHTMLSLRSFATRRALCQWQGQPECKWQKHSVACRALIFVAAFACGFCCRGMGNVKTSLWPPYLIMCASALPSVGAGLPMEH